MARCHCDPCPEVFSELENEYFSDQRTMFGLSHVLVVTKLIMLTLVKQQRRKKKIGKTRSKAKMYLRRRELQRNEFFNQLIFLLNQ